MFYFGCWKESGHYLFTPGQGRPLSARGDKMELYPECDTGFCPEWTREQGIAKISHTKGWTVLSFWDNSVDTRPGSHSTFMLKGQFNFEEMAQMAKELYPEVWARYTFKVRLV